MNDYSIILIIIFSYLIGSISGGVIVGKIRNTDIRQKGSKAAGATNAFRTMGTIFALTVLIIDVYKGYFVVEYIPSLLNNDTNTIKALAGIMCILGHAYPLYFKFKGGKGVGTALGALIAFPKGPGGVAPLRTPRIISSSSILIPCFRASSNAFLSPSYTLERTASRLVFAAVATLLPPLLGPSKKTEANLRANGLL